MEEDKERRKKQSHGNSHQDFRATILPISELAESQGFALGYETRKVIEETGQLGGRTVYRTRDGRALIVDRIPLCDTCSNVDMANPHVCHKCGRKICEDCWVRFRLVHYCWICLMIEEPLDKTEFKVLLAVAQKVANISKIARAIRIRKEEAQMTIARLLSNDYIMLSDGMLWKRPVLTEKGEEVVEAYLKIYRTSFDIFAFTNRLRE